MKYLILILLVVACSGPKGELIEIRPERMTLREIEIIQRWPDIELQRLIWQDDRNVIRYISFARKEELHHVGESIICFIR